jgi:CubicO group peptidase (beta-lactamase class C family)
MGRPLPRSRPADQHVDPAAVLAFLDAAEADPAVELHGLMVLRHGRVVAEGCWAPHTADRTRLLYSLSKSFTSTALGFAVQEGLAGLDDTVISHFPEFAGDITDPGSRAMRVRHVAAMASGHRRETVDEALAMDPAEPVRGFLLLPPDAPPGTVFAYNQPCTYTVGAIVQRAAGMRLTEYLRPRLFDPLGIGEVGWLSWPPGRDQGFSGLFARIEDVAKLGQLYLQRGRWGDRQLLSESWVAAATARQVDNPDQEHPDWRQGYGFQFWMSRHGYRGDGAFGQFCLILPEQDAVVAITAATEAMQAVLDHVWAHLLPGFAGARPDDAAQPALDARLGSLRLPPYAGTGRADWPAGTFGIAAPGPFTSVELGPDRTVTLADPDDKITFAAGTGEWRVSGPVAASGGWVDRDTLRVEVIFLETPHRLDLTCALPGRTAAAAWRLTPLIEARLGLLRRPA